MITIDKQLVQWELNRTVSISTDKDYNEVHFYNCHCKKALVVKPKNDTARIPNILLQADDDIIVWLVYAEGDTERSIAREQFSVTGRMMPDDYVYEETEVITFKKLVEDVNKAVENANAIVKDLEEKRDSGYFNGADGKDGYTPQKGVDYWTADDIAEIHSYIDRQLGVIENGSY